MPRSPFSAPHHGLDFDAFDDARSPRPAPADFDAVVDRAISRRALLQGGVALGVTAFLGAYVGQSASAATDNAASFDDGFSFSPLSASTADAVRVPSGYRAEPLVKWGDPILADGSGFDPATRGTPETQARAFGDNNDGMEFFSHNGRHVLAVNNEFTNLSVMFGDNDGQRPQSEQDREKSMAACGLSFVEVQAGTDGRWRPAPRSELNRRVTPSTPIEIAGPARGHRLMRTRSAPAGTSCHGTFANCGTGRTPWGTFLTCEENFNGYYSASDPAWSPDNHKKRYGIRDEDWGYRWAKIDPRFDVSRDANASNHMGWVVEVDPFRPDQPPVKRTALGRFKHENAELVIARDGRVVVYMGDDERGEYLYRFVSRGRWVEGGSSDGLLDEGTLYAAKFDDDGTGRWLALTPQTTGLADVAEICIRTRQAASAIQATTMDRPEWVAAHPDRAEVFCALTNNKNRGEKPNAGGDAQPVDGVNPRANNRYGQIVRWRPDADDHASETFRWDLFVLAGNPAIHDDANAGSASVTEDNMFNAPDGLAVDTRGILWIQTDGKTTNTGRYAGMGNNQMLAANPATGEIKRFLTAPAGAEVTGLTWSPDRRTMFVGIQHPGEKAPSTWPDGGLPRSAVVAITRVDGGRVG
ncbi:MAG: PhoX family phosphatase [Pseudomonadota bacterium]